MQNVFALDHEFSEQHFSDCEHSICINPTLLDGFDSSAAGIKIYTEFFKNSVSAELKEQITQHLNLLHPPSRAPPQ